MAVSEETNRRINRNRDYTETFLVTNSDGTPKDITDDDFVLELRKTVNAADPALLNLTSSPAAGIAIVLPATNGIIEVTITDIQTAALPSGVFPFDVYLIAPDTTKVTVISGFFSVHDSTAI